MDVTVSVVMPVYNVAPYVERCLLSIMHQTFPATECIIVDDGSTDDSITRCQRLIEGYTGPTNFSILHHSQNRGLSAARNTGTDAATSTYIYYVDSDDEITSDCIEKLAKIAFENPNTEMVLGNIQIISGEEKILLLNEKLPSELYSSSKIVSLYHEKLIPGYAWNKLIKRSFLNQHQLYFREGLIFEDFLWMFYVVKYLSNIAFCRAVTYLYYERPFSIITSSDNSTTGNSFKMIYDDILHHLTKGRERIELNRYVTGFCKCYFKYVEEISAYEDLYALFLSQAKLHKSWRCLTILAFVRMIGHFGHPLALLRFFNSVRLSIKSISKWSNII